MNRYVSGIPSELNQRIDQPLFEGFNKHATETISRIHFNDFKTKNTVGLHESWAAAGGGYAYSGTDLRQDICLADFLGDNVGKGTGNGYASNTPTDCVQGFADLFKSDYETLKSAGGLDSSKIKDLNDYLDNIAKMGEFDHKMDQPFKSFISGLLDVTIIKPLIECGYGYDLITGEDLTSFELTMKGVFALVDILTIGTAALATEGMELGTKETLIFVAKTAAVNMGANAASYTAGYISDAAGAPLAITMLLSMGAGVTVSKVAGKYFFKSAGGKLLGDCNVPGENVDDIIRDGRQLENGKLKPNVAYQTGENDYIYKTNKDGLITNAHTNQLQFKTHEGRLNHNPNTYDKGVGDQAGHLFGDRFGGSPELDNLVSQAQKVNQGEFKIIENQWANSMKSGKKVTVDMDVDYAAGSKRPIAFDISYTIDDVPYFIHINN